MREIPSLRALAGGLFVLAMSSCLGAGVEGECEVDAECGQRGFVCDTVANECVPLDFEADRTGPDVVGGEFGPTLIPFLRGMVCTMEEVESGTFIPVTVTPCLHPCMTLETDPPQTYVYHTCAGGNCEGYPVTWLNVSGTGCPADVFASFSRDQCTMDTTATMEFRNIQLQDGTPVSGSFIVEMPYLSNDDIAAVAAASSETRGQVLKDRVRQYPPVASRRWSVRLAPDGASPPPDGCATDGTCTCREIGFD